MRRFKIYFKVYYHKSVSKILGKEASEHIVFIKGKTKIEAIKNLCKLLLLHSIAYKIDFEYNNKMYFCRYFDIINNNLLIETL